MSTVSSYLSEVSDLIASIPENEVQGIVDIIRNVYLEGRQLLILGNGGSAATASHIVCDLQKSVWLLTGQRFKVMSVTDNVPLITAWANDTDYTRVFAEQVRSMVEPGDVLLAISGSGNSPNVIEAVKVANDAGALTVGLTGFDGGRLAQTAQKSLVVNSQNMQQIEDVHMVLAHLIFTCLMKEFGR